MLNKKFFLLFLLVVFVVALRLVPHLPNFTPVIAVALMAGIYLGKKWAIILPLAGLLISDFFVGLYELPLMLIVYGSFAIIGLFSWWLRKNKNLFNVFVASLLASLFFFITTNLAVWAFTPWYSKDLAGLVYCFQLAVPFFRHAVAGDLFYVVALFCVLELIDVSIKQKQLAFAH